MGLDVYVGSFARYYTGNWETVVQKFGRESGYEVEIVRPKADAEKTEAPLSLEEVRERVEEWRAGLNDALGARVEGGFDWDEAPSCDYFTDKPAWDCYGALVFVAAHDEHPEFQLPQVVPRRLDEYPAYRASTAPGSRSRYIELLQPELWLPCRFGFTFQYQDLAGREVWIGSSILLLEQLTELNERTFKGTEKDLIQWRRDGADFGAPLEVSAKFALSILVTMARLSVLHRLPMKLDY